MMPLTFCFFLQVVILMISLPATHCRRSFQSNDENLLENTCKKTPNYNLCLQCLKSDTRSSSADVRGLALIMVKVMKTKANDALNKIHKLQAGGGSIEKEALSYCARLYNDGILSTDIPEATEALQKGNPKFAEEAANGSANLATLCEKDFSGKSPITKENNDMHDVATITTAIVRLLL